MDHQFYGRGADGLGWLRCAGKVDRPGAKVTLTVTADGQPYRQETATGNTYAFKVGLRPGFVHYRATVTSDLAGQQVTLHTAEDLVAGRAFIVEGQSNAVATDWGKGEGTYRSEWIRTFGSPSAGGKEPPTWGVATHRAPGGKHQVGYWAMELGQRIVEQDKVPVCFINGAVGGTRIDQHQRNEADPTDAATIYGRLLARVRGARLTHEVDAIFWHQGENDQGADGPGASGTNVTASISTGWRAPGASTTRTCATTTCSRSGRSPARWESMGPTTACARCSGACPRISPR